MATLVERFDAQTERSGKILTEVQAVKQALIDLRNAPPPTNDVLSPEAEAALVRAEEALGRIDEVSEDGTPP